MEVAHDSTSLLNEQKQKANCFLISDKHRNSSELIKLIESK